MSVDYVAATPDDRKAFEGAFLNLLNLQQLYVVASVHLLKRLLTFSPQWRENPAIQFGRAIRKGRFIPYTGSSPASLATVQISL